MKSKDSVDKIVQGNTSNIVENCVMYTMRSCASATHSEAIM